MDADPGDPIASWLDALTRRTEREVSLRERLVSGTEGNDVAVVEIGDDGLVEVHVSRYDERQPPTVIGLEPRFVRPGRDASDDARPLVSVVLDVYGDGGFQEDRDHFVVFDDPGEVGGRRVRVWGPGSYEGIDAGAVDGWSRVVAAAEQRWGCDPISC